MQFCIIYMKFKGEKKKTRRKRETPVVVLFLASSAFRYCLRCYPPLTTFLALELPTHLPFPESSPCFQLTLVWCLVPAFPRSSPNHAFPPYIFKGAFRKQFLSQTLE